MAIISKAMNGALHARCAQCVRHYFLGRRAEIAQFYLARKRYRRDLCPPCRHAAETGHYDYCCAGCDGRVTGTLDVVRPHLNIRNMALCRSCRDAYYGRYDENNAALSIALKAIDAKAYRKCPRSLGGYEDYCQLERDYMRNARNRTRQTYRHHKRLINPDNLPIAPSGVPGGHHLDHIVPVSLCFRVGVPVELVAAAENLQIVPWRINLLRGEICPRRMIKKEERPQKTL